LVIVVAESSFAGDSDWDCVDDKVEFEAAAGLARFVESAVVGSGAGVALLLAAPPGGDAVRDSAGVCAGVGFAGGAGFGLFSRS